MEFLSGRCVLPLSSYRAYYQSVVAFANCVSNSLFSGDFLLRAPAY